MKLSLSGCFDGKNINKDGNVDFKFKFPYSEIANYASLLTALHAPMKMAIVSEDGTKYIVGVVYIKSIRIDKDGEASVTFNNGIDSIKDVDLTSLIQKNATIKLIKEN